MKVHFDVLEDRVVCRVIVKAFEKTGVEIEAVAGVMNSLLAILDLTKRYEKDETGKYPTTQISDIKILDKQKVI